MKMPSADNIRRSRSATSSGSPMSISVHEDQPGALLRAEARAALGDLERQAVAPDEGVVAVDADGLRPAARAGADAGGRRASAARSAAASG